MSMTIRRDSPTTLMRLANNALVIHLLKFLRAHISELFKEELEFNPLGQGPFLYKMSQDLWRICRDSREHKAALQNTDFVIMDIANYVDKCAQQAECGYFWRAEFIEDLNFMATRLRAMLDFQ